MGREGPGLYPPSTQPPCATAPGQAAVWTTAPTSAPRRVGEEHGANSRERSPALCSSRASSLDPRDCPQGGVVITDPLPSGTLRHRGMGLAKIPQPFAGDRCPGHPPTPRRPDRKRWTKGKSQDRKGTWGPDPGVRLDETSQRRLRPGPGRRALPPPKQRSPWKATRVTACRNAQAGRGRARWPQPTRGQRHVPGASARGSCLGTGTPACPLPPPPPPPPPAWEPP